MQEKAQFDDRIRNLIALAEDNSVESRTLLFSHICDLFLQDRPMETGNQIRMLVEIINELINDVDISIRIELCNILLNMDHPPEPLIKLISEDIIEVSGKLLEQALINEEQLLYLIKYASNDHREYISGRFGLSPLLRRELEEARKSQANNIQKTSLNQLEEDRQNSNELNEDVTADILEILKATKHKLPDIKNDISLIRPIVKEKASPAPRDVVPKETEKIEDIDQPLSLTANLKEKLVAGHSEPHEENIIEDVEELNQSIEKTTPQTILPQMADKWFWEVDRKGNLTYLSENSKNAFNSSVDLLIGTDFLSLWTKDGRGGTKEEMGSNDNHEFITLFEKRTAFRDEQFLLSLPNHEINSYLLSAIATFDMETGRFTGLRGSAQIENIEKRNPVLSNSKKMTFTSDNSKEDELDDEKIINEDYIHKPTFSDDIKPQTNEIFQVPDSDNDDEAGLVFTPTEEDFPENQDEIAAELLHNLSHEFRTPLNAIIGFSQMIDNEMWGPVSNRYRKNTKDIIDAANSLKESVNNVLDGAKIDAGLIIPSPGSFSLKSIIQEAKTSIAPILESKEIKISGIDDNIDVILYNDKHCIILCLVKMITFATKQASLGSELHISVLVNSNAQVRIEIPLLNMNLEENDSDGVFQKITLPSGFSAQNKEKDAKYNTKISSGFGLSVAQDIAKLIGGKISTHCENGKITHIALTISTYPI